MNLTVNTSIILILKNFTGLGSFHALHARMRIWREFHGERILSCSREDNFVIGSLPLAAIGNCNSCPKPIQISWMPEVEDIEKMQTMSCFSAGFIRNRWVMLRISPEFGKAEYRLDRIQAYKQEKQVADYFTSGIQCTYTSITV